MRLAAVCPHWNVGGVAEPAGQPGEDLQQVHVEVVGPEPVAHDGSASLAVVPEPGQAVDPP